MILGIATGVRDESIRFFDLLCSIFFVDKVERGVFGFVYVLEMLLQLKYVDAQIHH